MINSGVYVRQYLSSESMVQPSVFSTNTKAQPHNYIGEMRYNSQSDVVEYCTGSTWMTVPMQYSTLSLDPDVVSIIEWAKKKMVEEAALQAKLDKYPSLKEMYDQFKILDSLTNETPDNDL